jgi:DNA-binding beta-propeller fold protein YncE
MDEATLVRELLDRATRPEPPIGPMAQNAIRAGLRLRRRRRIVQSAAAGTAAAVAISLAALAGTGVIGNRPAAPAPTPATVYVLGGTQTLGTVTPISTITNRPGRPIVVERGNWPGAGPRLAVTPDRKTIWVADNDDDVTPISTVTNRPEKPIRVVHQPDHAVVQVLAAPDDKTIYVLDSTVAVTPISTATHQKGKPIQVGPNAAHHGEGAGDMAITPDGKTLYVVVYPPGPYPSYVVPIATATGQPGTPIGLPISAGRIVFTPDGRRAYVFGYSTARTPRIEVIPIVTAGNHLGTPIIIGSGFIPGDTPVVMTPDGRMMYLPYGPDESNGLNGVIPFSTVTNKPGKLISVGSASVEGIAISPDGGTAYVVSQPIGPGPGSPACAGPPGDVTPIATATNTIGRPVKVPCEVSAAALTPDGRTLYVSERGTVTPVATATGQVGEPIPVEGPAEILIVPRPG